MFSLPKIPTVETFGVSLDTLKVEGALTAVKDKVNESTKDAGGIFDFLDKLKDVTAQMEELKAQTDNIIPDDKPKLPSLQGDLQSAMEAAKGGVSGLAAAASSLGKTMAKFSGGPSIPGFSLSGAIDKIKSGGSIDVRNAVPNVVVEESQVYDPDSGNTTTVQQFKVLGMQAEVSTSDSGESSKAEISLGDIKLSLQVPATAAVPQGMQQNNTLNTVSGAAEAPPASPAPSTTESEGTWPEVIGGGVQLFISTPHPEIEDESFWKPEGYSGMHAMLVGATQKVRATKIGLAQGIGLFDRSSPNSGNSPVKVSSGGILSMFTGFMKKDLALLESYSSEVMKSEVATVVGAEGGAGIKKDDPDSRLQQRLKQQKIRNSPPQSGITEGNSSVFVRNSAANVKATGWDPLGDSKGRVIGLINNSKVLPRPPENQRKGSSDLYGYLVK